MKLYTYSLSSAAYRVRIALNLKGVAHDKVPVHLRKADHQADEYKALNPQGLVPALGLDDGTVIAQSMAIVEYLEETYAQPPLLPPDPVRRARVRAVAYGIACDIHPLNNLRVLNYLRERLGQDNDGVRRWYHEWLRHGFDALEQMIDPAPFCFGAAPGLADICLVPQVANARRFEFPLDPYPKIVAVDAACQPNAAFADAHPSLQSDE